MFDKAKPTKQELRKLAKGMEAAITLGVLITALDGAIEGEIKSLAFIDANARRELSRTQLSLGVGRAYLNRLIADGEAYLTGLKSKPAAKAKAAGKKKPAAKKKAATKAKAKSVDQKKIAAGKARKPAKY